MKHELCCSELYYLNFAAWWMFLTDWLFGCNVETLCAPCVSWLYLVSFTGDVLLLISLFFGFQFWCLVLFDLPAAVKSSFPPLIRVSICFLAGFDELILLCYWKNCKFLGRNWWLWIFSLWDSDCSDNLLIYLTHCICLSIEHGFSFTDP